MDEFLKNTLAENIIGLSGTFFVISALIPQIYKTFKKKSVKDLSMKWLITEGMGSGFMITYGVLKKDILIILINCIITFSHFILLIGKCKFKEKPIVSNLTIVSNITTVSNA